MEFFWIMLTKCLIKSLCETIVVTTSSKCDIFIGNWVPNPSGPVYTNVSCRHIQDHQNCLRNGRPDVNYLLWRWQPRDCDLPRFNPQQFLDKMRNKWWAFIGDSISRNHVQSLLCALSQVQFSFISNLILYCLWI